MHVRALVSKSECHFALLNSFWQHLPGFPLGLVDLMIDKMSQGCFLASNKLLCGQVCRELAISVLIHETPLGQHAQHFVKVVMTRLCHLR